MRAVGLFLVFAVAGCGGAPFESGPIVVTNDAGTADETSAPETSADLPDASPNLDATTPDAACTPSVAATYTFCGASIASPFSFAIDYGMQPPGDCPDAGSAMRATPDACLCDYSCECLRAADVCSTWSGCTAGSGILVVTCR